ncbi:MFS transporter [Pandoraea pulmonicola]|uniref:MFS transporter n=1 Tax=Pandoraea pulmonicola TaxID=93221 RepID=A0AAJ4ZFE9_PANPU|nr:MFS transporter [Pandoraea pulmonicola]AJC19479.1 MFS transporter [Pandoraea pulmonicola]SUA92477.1 Spectinomycin tetracycline efflux pump [Pandoraea pulmonicola]
MSSSRRRALVCAAYLGTFLASLDISIVNVALPTLQVALHTDMAGLQWVINAYAIAISAFMLSAGPLGDRYGHKPIWLASVAFFTAGSALCAVAGQLDTLLAGRAIQGVAGALLIPSAMPILTQAFPDARERARVIGGWSAFSALALVLGPISGGLLIEHLGWQSIFLVNLPLGAVALALGMFGIPGGTHGHRGVFDPAGQCLSVVWLGAMTYGLIRMGEPDAAPEALAPIFGVAFAALALFVWVERRVARPLLPVSMLREARMRLANVASFTLGFSGYASLFFLSLFLQQAQGHPPAQAGWQLMPQFLTMGVTSLLFGRIAHRAALGTLIVAGYAAIGLTLCAMTAFTAGTPYWVVGAAFAGLGLGMGLAVPGTGMMVMNLAPAAQTGMASATMNALRQTGMTMGIALLGSVMNLRAAQDLTATARTHGVTHAPAFAHTAISGHMLDPALTWLPDAYRHARAQGFALATLGGGLACTVIAALLYRQHARYARDARPSAATQTTGSAGK